jgi:hypothetical protein
MRSDSIRLNRFHRYLLYSVLGLLFLSGAAWAWWNYVTRAGGEFEMAAKSWALKIHGAAAMATLILIGTLLTTHIKCAWRARRNRPSGALFLGLLGILTITGYGLYYAGGEAVRAWSDWIHLGAGLVLPLFLAIHVWTGKKSRRMSGTPSPKPLSAPPMTAKIDV